ncbi:MAG: hypothetical protein QOH13_1752 [Thermoleophilaceae bacterium]|jgi:hypothetical protein|nr:hypothetical protein [Thermoleophilaceae bacterium]
MGRVASFLFTLVILEVLWALLVGTTQSTELIVGLPAAAIGALFAELLRSLGFFGLRTHGGLLGKALKLPWLVPFDFGLATWVLARALVHGRRVQGEWTRVPFPTEPGATGRWQRAFGVATSNGAANAIVVDLDEDEALLHALEPTVFSGRSVL